MNFDINGWVVVISLVLVAWTYLLFLIHGQLALLIREQRLQTKLLEEIAGNSGENEA